jgi:hypothetical protein
MTTTSKRERSRSRKDARSKKRLTAKTADRHVLYQLSVQAPENEVAFLDRVFKKISGRRPLSLREDFCGTALLCKTWAESSPERTATGVDIDPKVLAWAKRHNLAPDDEASARVRLLRQNVLKPVLRRYDIVCGFNFSYWVFKSRELMRAYFQRARGALARDGLFFLDLYGGWDGQRPQRERRRIRGGFTYIWDQYSFDPISHDVLNYIHFEFPDGTKIERAFEYDWRFWSMPEIKELLLEAGFSDVRVYWDTSSDLSRDVYRERSRADNQQGWLAYVVAAR